MAFNYGSLTNGPLKSPVDSYLIGGMFLTTNVGGKNLVSRFRVTPGWRIRGSRIGARILASTMAVIKLRQNPLSRLGRAGENHGGLPPSTARAGQLN
jgi:hypothetical protein